MLAILAPAKKMDFDSELIMPEAVKTPFFMEQTKKLVSIAGALGIEDLKKIMKISDSIAENTSKNFEAFSSGEKNDKLRPAVFAFKGDTYKGLDADSFGGDDLMFAEEHLRILSGLYGILSPLTLIEPYRFEMGLSLKVESFKKISAFWKESVTDELNRLLIRQKEKIIINLASAEYMAVVDKKRLEAEILTVVFHEQRDGKLKTISTFSKKARGMMARYIVRERIEDCNRVKHFTSEGYQFEEVLSNDKRFVFVR